MKVYFKLLLLLHLFPLIVSASLLFPTSSHHQKTVSLLTMLTLFNMLLCSVKILKAMMINVHLLLHLVKDLVVIS